jgi:hypothetical protein
MTSAHVPEPPVTAGGDDGHTPAIEDQDTRCPGDLLARTRAEDELMLFTRWHAITAARLRRSITPCVPPADADRQMGDL